MEQVRDLQKSPLIFYKNALEKRHLFQQMLLEKLDYHMQKNEIWPLCTQEYFTQNIS